MKNKIGKISGFVLGMVGFLLIFKLFILVNIPPEDEIAPGLVLIAAIFCGIIFSFLGNIAQNYFRKLN